LWSVRHKIPSGNTLGLSFPDARLRRGLDNWQGKRMKNKRPSPETKNTKTKEKERDVGR